MARMTVRSLMLMPALANASISFVNTEPSISLSGETMTSAFWLARPDRSLRMRRSRRPRALISRVKYEMVSADSIHNESRLMASATTTADKHVTEDREGLRAANGNVLFTFPSRNFTTWRSWRGVTIIEASPSFLEGTR